MAMRIEDWREAQGFDPGPIPPELMDDQLDDRSDAERMIEAAFAFATDSEVSVGQAVEMLADAEPDGWRIVDDDGAEWALRHIAAANGELEALRRRADSWRERIEAWFVQAAREPAQTAEFFTAHVEWYARQQRELDRKSFALPSGRVTTRSTAACADVADEEALIGWVDADAESRLLVAPPQPRKVYVSELRKRTSVVEVVDRARLVLSDGEIIEWARYEWVMGCEHDGTLATPDFAEGWHLSHGTCPSVGDGWPSPDEAEALVGQVEVVESHWQVVDEHGTPVPGVVVRPEHITVTVAAS